MGIKTRVARSTSDVVNCLPNATARLQWPLAGEMTADSHLPFSDELEALSESGFALAIQLLGRHEDAADVVQDALRKLIHSGRYKAQKGSPLAWFLKVVRNGALDTLRQRRPNDGEAVARLAATTPPPDIAVEREELAGIMRRKLETMLVDQREIILLRDFHDLSYTEIAEVLGIAPGTVMSRLHRARNELRKRMKKYLQ
ncbi:MAG: RNA polymerase sigma factor [Verrucomicrobiota bacterium]|jgi:RNA polymerase sigma-70 factor (ECF subfamily)|nr:RNA polymerase sigma factor [Verrucomicrobiota bacterium]MDP7442377.1 RNA polymerase sigma factor [Verrucomicrobiota bacterium]|tara:strand:+ start:3397 stop:3996 length:600 start_codon:yes stop_codon:yes gene_type:complete